jgi:hypothetical protein
MEVEDRQGDGLTCMSRADVDLRRTAQAGKQRRAAPKTEKLRGNT